MAGTEVKKETKPKKSTTTKAAEKKADVTKATKTKTEAEILANDMACEELRMRYDKLQTELTAKNVLISELNFEITAKTEKIVDLVKENDRVYAKYYKLKKKNKKLRRRLEKLLDKLQGGN